MTFPEGLHLAGALGAGLNAGIYFAFSVFIMQALARQQPANGIRAMQAINQTVITPLFLLVFLGTAVISLVSVIQALTHAPSSPLPATAGLLYLFGTFGITLTRNVPLNNQLAGLHPDTADAHKFWSTYQTAWTRWNTLRTLAALLSTALFLPS